jgi:hypothetical protein
MLSSRLNASRLNAMCPAAAIRFLSGKTYKRFDDCYKFMGAAENLEVVQERAPIFTGVEDQALLGLERRPRPRPNRLSYGTRDAHGRRAGGG